MKTYPYTTPEGIIELVRKDEHDEVVAELLARLEARTQSHLHASARDVQTIQQQSVILDRMATDLQSIYLDDIFDLTMREIARQALAAYESAKSGNLPDPLAEAVTRMEAVPWFGRCNCFNAVRARLISAAKGEQP